MDKTTNIIIAIIIGSIIMGGSLLIVQHEKQNSIERQVKMKIDHENEVMEAERQADLLRELKINHCLEQAEDNYWTYMELNGTGKRDDEKGIWAMHSVWDRANKNKQREIDNCYKKYKK